MDRMKNFKIACLPWEWRSYAVVSLFVGLRILVTSGDKGLSFIKDLRAEICYGTASSGLYLSSPWSVYTYLLVPPCHLLLSPL
jgi:hypothetical protein